ncbi:MAG: 1-acyl-sn-glycerol-3-phosphate acyltransferase [Bacteroidales bacterium]
MQRKRRIYEWNWAYSFFKPYVMLMFRLSYGRREYHGLEKIPANQPIIYAPNHTGALMDAMSVLDIDTSAKVFVARADMFKNPLFAKILFFLRIMPIHRIRDGRSSLKNNEEIIQESVEVLRNNVPFVIAPEGTHRPMHNLLPLGKGIFRIALLANEELNKPQPDLDSARQVHIVPVGLEYGHFFRYRTSLLCQIGDPINVTQYVADNPDKEQPVLMNELKELLEEGLKELILYIPDDDDYTATWELCGLCAPNRIKQMGLKKHSLKDRLQANRQTVQHVLEKKETAPEESKRMLEEIARFAQKRRQKRISMTSVANPAPLVALLTRIPLLILLFPYFVACTIPALPTLFLTWFICSKMEDRAFHNSVRYIITMVLWTLTVIIAIPLLFILMPWPLALLILLLGLPAPFFFYQYNKWFRIARSNIRWLLSRDLRKDKKRFVNWIA